MLDIVVFKATLSFYSFISLFNLFIYLYIAFVDS